MQEVTPLIVTPVSGPLTEQAAYNTETINAVGAQTNQLLMGRDDIVIVVLIIALCVLGALWIIGRWHKQGFGSMEVIHLDVRRVKTRVKKMQLSQADVIKRVESLEEGQSEIVERVAKVETLVKDQRFSGTITDKTGNRSDQKIVGEIHPMAEEA